MRLASEAASLAFKALSTMIKSEAQSRPLPTKVSRWHGDDQPECIAQDFNRLATVLQFRAAVLNGFTALGIAEAVTIG